MHRAAQKAVRPVGKEVPYIHEYGKVRHWFRDGRE